MWQSTTHVLFGLILLAYILEANKLDRLSHVFRQLSHFGAGMFGCGMAGSFQHLLAWRWVTGLGSALQMSGSHLCLADISKSSTRTRCLGTNQVVCLIHVQHNTTKYLVARLPFTPHFVPSYVQCAGLLIGSVDLDTQHLATHFCCTFADAITIICCRQSRSTDLTCFAALCLLCCSNCIVLSCTALLACYVDRK